MSHQFDLTMEDVIEKVRDSREIIPFVPSLYERIFDVMEGDPNLWKMNDPETYTPTNNTDSFEAALLAAAWKFSSEPLFRRFGKDGVEALFERFRPFGLIGDDVDLTVPMRVFRGTSGPAMQEDYVRMAWTTDAKAATYFALTHHKSQPRLLSSLVEPDQILMCLSDDPESEVVLRVGAIKSVSIEEVRRASDYAPKKTAVTSY